MEIKNSTVAFIGTGVMGSSMAGHLLAAGARVRVYNRSKPKAESLLSKGAAWAGSPAEATKDADIVFTMVGYPADVEQVYLGPGGLVGGARRGAILVDCTTSDPALAARIATEAESAGLGALDAPVSGGDSGARNATLTIMVGGDGRSFAAAKPFLEAMGKTIVLQGGPGAGQHTKAANQIAVAASLIGTVEALLYSEKAGLDPRRVLDSIGGGSAQSWQLTGNGPKMLDGNFEPGFYCKHFLKDLRIALDAAASMKVRFPMLELAESLFERMKEKGFSEKGTQALYLLYKAGAA